MTIDTELARHCLEDLGGRSCPIVKQRTVAHTVLEEGPCAGLSIRDTLLSFLVQALEERDEYEEQGLKKLYNRAYGQVEALTYAVALIDNPYRPNGEAVLVAARLEVDL
jgi:hypothetical protein